MMDTEKGINENLKISIKRKLKESGTYIDDELPEYIMVMIANKRNEFQMKEDLSLFLGDRTEQFVTWVFGMLKQLQDITQDDAINIDQNSDRNVEKTSTENLGLSPGHLTKEERDLTVQKKDNCWGSENHELETYLEEKTVDRRKQQKEIRMDDQSMTKTGKETVKLARATNDKRQKNFLLQPSQSPSSTKPESCIGSERELKSTRKRNLTSECITKKPRISPNDEKGNRGGTSNRASSLVTIQKERHLLPSGQVPDLHIQKTIQDAPLSFSSAPVEPKDNTMEVKPLKLIETEKSADDGIEIEVPENEFSNEETDCRKMSNTRVVVCRTDLSNFNKICINEKDVPFSDKKIHGPILNEDYKLQGSKNDDDGPRRRCFSKSDGALLEEKKRRDQQRHRHRREKYRHNRDKRQISPRFVVTLHGTNEEMQMSSKEKPNVSKNQTFRCNDLLSSGDPLFIDLNPKAPLEILESAQQEIDNIALRLNLMQGVQPNAGANKFTGYESIEQKRIPISSTITAPLPVLLAGKPNCSNSLPLFSGHLSSSEIPMNQLLQPHRISDVIAAPSSVIFMRDTPRTAGSDCMTRARSREVIVPADYPTTDDVIEEECSAEHFADDSKGIVVERCKFWPNCKSKSCQFIHPAKPCRSFPNCCFKDKCLFLHPMCKFDKQCSKPLCPYTHSRKQQRKASGSQLHMEIPICMFYPNCSKTNCNFRHPFSKPCRYGSGCNRPNCKYHHETRPATGDALKWNANLKSFPSHISDRKFVDASVETAAAPVAITT